MIVLLNWMIWNKKLKHATITSYLAGIRQLHKMKGMGKTTCNSSGAEAGEGAAARLLAASNGQAVGVEHMLPSLQWVFPDTRASVQGGGEI